MTTTETPLHIQQAEALRALASFVEANHDLAETMRNAFNKLNAFSDDPAMLAQFIKAGKRAGAEATKEVNGNWFYASLRWGPVVLDVNAHRDAVCERVQVGTETVTKTVPDPEKLAEVPEVEVTVSVPIYEWECKPLLASTKDGE